MSTKTALIMRATGAQGKGAIFHLVKAGWKIHALVSDVSSNRAIALKCFGQQVSLYQGTWKDPLSIKNAVKGCQVLLLNQITSYIDDAELQEARIVLKLAKEAGVQHVVFPTSLPLNNPNVKERYKGSPVAPGILNKADVEELVKACGLTWTLLRPGYFTTNLLAPIIYWMFPEIKEGKIINSYGPECIITLVDPDDIGAFIAAAFDDPERFGGKIIAVVSENVRFDDMMREFSKASGLSLEIVYRTAEETEKEKNNAFIAGQVLCQGLDKYVDMDEVKSWGITLTSFKQFLEKRKHELPNGEVSGENKYSAIAFAKSMAEQRGV